MSKENLPSSENQSLGEILEAALAANNQAKSVTEIDRIAALEDRLASMEPLLEQLQATSALGTKLTDYVGDLRAEQDFFNLARYVVGAAALLVVIGLSALLGFAIFHPNSPLLSSPPVAIAAFVVGLVSSIALLLNSIVKGVFRSTSERHADGFLPPALEHGLEVFTKVTGRH